MTHEVAFLRFRLFRIHQRVLCRVSRVLEEVDSGVITWILVRVVGHALFRECLL